jgi:hypothetical protein
MATENFTTKPITPVLVVDSVISVEPQAVDELGMVEAYSMRLR